MAMSNAWYRAEYRPFAAEKARIKGNFKESMPMRFIETEHYPRYYFADQIVTIKDRQDFLQKLIGEKFSSKVAFITRPGFVPGNGIVRSVVETANRATIDVDSFGQGFLVMSVTPHKYWSIYLDDVRVPAVVTNIGYQGIVVTPGHHRVIMVYRNELVLVGLGISGVVGLIMLLIAIFGRGGGDYSGIEAYEEAIHVVADDTGPHIERADP